MTESDSLTATAFRVLIAVRRFTNRIFRKCCMIKTGPVQSFVIFLSFVFQILLGSSIYSLIFDCYFFCIVPALFLPHICLSFFFLSSFVPFLYPSFVPSVNLNYWHGDTTETRNINSLDSKDLFISNSYLYRLIFCILINVFFLLQVCGLPLSGSAIVSCFIAWENVVDLRYVCWP